MSPQPTTPPAAQSAQTSNGQTDANPHAKLLKRIADKPADERTSVEKQVARAVRLEIERAEVMQKIAANREYLRLMEDNEEIDDEDTLAFLDDFYPTRERGSARNDAEVERTRKVKDAARKLKF